MTLLNEPDITQSAMWSVPGEVADAAETQRLQIAAAEKWRALAALADTVTLLQAALNNCAPTAQLYARLEAREADYLEKADMFDQAVRDARAADHREQ